LLSTPTSGHQGSVFPKLRQSLWGKHDPILLFWQLERLSGSPLANDPNPIETLSNVLNGNEDSYPPNETDSESNLDNTKKKPSTFHHLIVEYRYWVLFCAPVGVLLVHLFSAWLSQKSNQPLVSMASSVSVVLGECASGDGIDGNVTKFAACLRFNQTNQG